MDARRSEPSRKTHERRQLWEDLDGGWTMTVGLLTATFVWGGIGWLVDRWLGSAPWVMVSGFVLGFVLGNYLVFVRAEEQWHREEAKRPRL